MAAIGTKIKPFHVCTSEVYTFCKLQTSPNVRYIQIPGRLVKMQIPLKQVSGGA